MPFIPNTPESILLRSDSKNPAATCSGLTSTGRACRRGLAKSAQSSSAPSSGKEPDGFCWQHKDQAHTALLRSPQSMTIKERNSVDTLAERLGLLEVEKRKRRNSVPKQELPLRPAQKPQSKSNLGLFCCIGEADDGKRAPRPAKQPDRRNTSAMPNNTKTNRPPIARDPSSRTGEFLSLIPPSTTPETTALLLAEMAKPVSQHDDEGYIYIFWLTPSTLPEAPPSEAAQSLLLPPPTRPQGQRRTSDVLNTFASNAHTPHSSQKTILLKIGRAQNIQRRLNQWMRQCGYNLSLIRYYPYHPSSTTPSSTGVMNEGLRTPRRVPYVHKVERLIHIELNGQRAVGSGKCGACRREHREWFEVEASRKGVKAVDEVVRRWVEWGERNAMR